MSRRLYKTQSVTPQMNMTPLIDVTFQLIIFFMVVSNLIGQEAIPMRVPVLEDPQTRQLGQSDRVVVNVLPSAHGSPWVHVGLTRFSGADHNAIRDTIKQMVLKNADLEVVLRAESSLAFTQVQPVIAAIRQAGVSTVHLVAQDQPAMIGGKP